MLSRALSAYVIGIDAHLIEVEVDITSRGLPQFSLVGCLIQRLKRAGTVSGQRSKTSASIFRSSR
jgi:hypothetical protein